MEPEPEPEPEPRVRTFTASERIAELNEIDKSVTALLLSAGNAIKILSNSSSTSSTSSTSLVPTTTTTLDGQKAAFTATASSYFSILSSIDVRLRRQVYALEEANLVTAGDERDARRGRVAAGGADEREASAGGPLDASWLNSRARDTVGRDMERELWAKAREWVERLEKRADSQSGLTEGGEDKHQARRHGDEYDGDDNNDDDYLMAT